MAATVTALPRRETPSDAALEVVAVILADGSVKPLGGRREKADAASRLSAGTIAGADWLLWWERRRFAQAG